MTDLIRRIRCRVVTSGLVMMLGVAVPVLVPRTVAAAPASAEYMGFVDEYLRWVVACIEEAPSSRPKEAYGFASDLHGELAELVREAPQRVTPIQIGLSLQGRPVWAFRVREHRMPVRRRLLVIANIHALEWITSEVAVEYIRSLSEHPPPGVEVVVVPILNPDGRAKVERDLVAGEPRYRRGNAINVDLNRDFAVNRTAKAIWRHLIPRRFEASPAALSQPESQALDSLAARERFDVAVSLHSWGGWLFYPWAGDWERPRDRRRFELLAESIQRGQGARAYQPKQLGRWAFFFRGHGMELDHLYGEYGTLSFLWEVTRGRNPLDFAGYGDPFQIYNPRDPSRAVQRDVGGLWSLTSELSFDARGLLSESRSGVSQGADPIRPSRTGTLQPE